MSVSDYPAGRFRCDRETCNGREFSYPIKSNVFKNSRTNFLCINGLARIGTESELGRSSSGGGGGREKKGKVIWKDIGNTSPTEKAF